MELLLFDNIDEFEGSVFPFLEENEAENSLILGLATRTRSQPPPTLFMGAVVKQDRVVMAGLVAGQSLILTRAHGPAVELFVSEVARRAPQLPGVLGSVESVESFSKLWTTASGRKIANIVQHRIYVCDRVVPGQPTRGRMRLAGRQDVDLIDRWLSAFHREALPHEQWSAEKTRAFAEARVESGSLSFWEVDGECHSMAALGRPTRRTITVNAVYTPPEFRNRGFAGSLVSAITQKSLDEGYRGVVLYTDLANPVSNSVYQKIGYKAVADSVHHRFAVT